MSLVHEIDYGTPRSRSEKTVTLTIDGRPVTVPEGTSIMRAAMTLGTKKLKLLLHVVIPGVLPDLYRDQRILLGWAWTYLIVAELVGTSSGITWYITQQARYEHFDNVYAAIMMIGIIGLGTDLVLAWVGRKLFPWDRSLKT